MKQLLYLLFAVTLFTSCSSDDDPIISHDYTSFVFFHSEDVTLINCVVGYKKDGKYYKLGNIGNLAKNQYSTEIQIEDSTIKQIYLFTGTSMINRLDAVYSIKNNTKNTFKIADGTKGIEVTDKTDPTQYPQ